MSVDVGGGRTIKKKTNGERAARVEIENEAVDQEWRGADHDGTEDVAAVNFFFQAEDSIRHGHVTGVQTCALPISTGSTSLSGWLSGSPPGGTIATGGRRSRSEERRVGKECRSRWAPDQ